MFEQRFRDRRDAGQRLGQVLADRQHHDPIVLALPRGGVPIGAEVAGALAAPLEVVVARKVGAPHNPELGVGAVAEGGGLVLHERTMTVLGLSAADLAGTIAAEREELDRRCRLYRGDAPLPDLSDRDVIVVDDGLATGVTAEAALGGLRNLSPRSLLLAVPVAAPDTVARLRAVADVVALQEPERFGSVGSYYDDFGQTSDAEVQELLARHRVPSSP